MAKHMRILLMMIMVFVTNNAVATNKFEEAKCIQTLEKTCIEQGEKIIDGFKVDRCWKYEERFKCVSREENHCSIFEENRGCNQLSAQCLKESETRVCRHFEKKFVCGSKTSDTEEIKLVNTEYEVLKDEKDLSNCNAQEMDKYCKLESEICVEKGETRNINGKNVYKDCWRWNRKYLCRTDSYIDECKDLKSRCREIKRECVHDNHSSYMPEIVSRMIYGKGRCEHFVVEYMCEDKELQKVNCIGMKFCIGGVCKEQERNVNNNFGTAISYLSVLNSFKNDSQDCTCDKEKNPNCDINQSNCRIFSGQAQKCRRYTGEFNCCSRKGLVLHVASCKESEKELQLKREGALCHYVGVWKEGKNWWDSFKKRKVFCCFNSKLARIVQEGGRRQLGIGWGSAKNPDCRALTMGELQHLDFEKIDMSEISYELEAKAQRSYKRNKESLKNKFNNLKTSPESTKGQIYNKMKYYGNEQK